MKRLITALFILLASVSFAQKKQTIHVERGSAFTINADEPIWEELTDVANEGRWFYKLAQDADHLYIAIRISDELLQNYAVRDGINIQFMADHKKQKDRVFVYPYPDKEVKRSLQQAGFDPEKDYKSDLIGRSRGYYVTGFPSIVDGLLSFQNNYGLYAEARMLNKQFYYTARIAKSLIPIGADGFGIKLRINDNLSALLQAANKRGAGSQTVIQGLQVEKGQDKSKKKATTVLFLQAVLGKE